MARYDRGILVTGGGSFLGDSIAAALLAEGAEVSLLVRPGAEERLGQLAQQTRWSTADVWNPASLRGKARNHAAVIHTVGSLNDDPARGLSYHRLNFVSARNAANMCVSDGVEYMILMSAVQAPWVSRDYIRSKRAAENYLRRAGLRISVIRAPLAYIRGRPRPLFYSLMTLLGSIPPLSWLMFGRIAPMPIDMLARVWPASPCLMMSRSRFIIHAICAARAMKRGRPLMRWRMICRRKGRQPVLLKLWMKSCPLAGRRPTDSHKSALKRAMCLVQCF